MNKNAETVVEEVTWKRPHRELFLFLTLEFVLLIPSALLFPKVRHQIKSQWRNVTGSEGLSSHPKPTLTWPWSAVDSCGGCLVTKYSREDRWLTGCVGRTWDAVDKRFWEVCLLPLLTRGSGKSAFLHHCQQEVLESLPSFTKDLICVRPVSFLRYIIPDPSGRFMSR